MRSFFFGGQKRSLDVLDALEYLGCPLSQGSILLEVKPFVFFLNAFALLSHVRRDATHSFPAWERDRSRLDDGWFRVAFFPGLTLGVRLGNFGTHGDVQGCLVLNVRKSCVFIVRNEKNTLNRIVVRALVKKHSEKRGPLWSCGGKGSHGGLFKVR